MAFTDDDLDWLKRDLPMFKRSLMSPISYPRLEALIARLEAAEHYIHIVAPDGSLGAFDRAGYEAWHRSKGEDGIKISRK